ncbi:phospholipase D-like domain-containing protein [Vibrio tritonius]|uniref:phospholipase D-like domain-containing protein n=1 Tax=Vibrio tritonius TaxID=1435069 RepID=UPI00315DD196
MNLQQWQQWLKESLADVRLDDQERKDLKQKLAQLNCSDEERAYLRNQAFRLAHEAVESGEDARQVIRWLERIVKILDTARETQVSEIAGSWFSPGKACFNGIVEQLKLAQHHIDICVFTIADDDLTKHILQAHERGVEVRVITDRNKRFDVGSDVDYLARKGVQVKIDTSDYHMHHKFAIFDGIRMINGSFNWTRSASRYNQEDITLTDDERFITAFQQQFEKLWRQFPRHRSNEH